MALLLTRTSAPNPAGLGTTQKCGSSGRGGQTQKNAATTRRGPAHRSPSVFLPGFGEKKWSPVSGEQIRHQAWVPLRDLLSTYLKM